MHARFTNKCREGRWGSFYNSVSNISSSYSRTLQAVNTLSTCQRRFTENHKDRLLNLLLKTASKQQKQQAKEKKSQKSPEFPFKTVLFLTLTVLGALIYSDVQTNGSWKESKTAFYLKKYHVCEYSHKVLNKTSEGIKWMNTEIDKQFPGYEEKLHEILEPYGDMLGNLGTLSLAIAKNANEALVEFYTLLVEKIEKYAPGALEQTGEYVRAAGTATSTYTKKTYDYLRNEFFTGKLAPEHVGGVIMEALGSAQQKLNDFYVWANEKIRTTIK